jgi:glycosyltransferase involved in cell wall biosynthesis
MGDVMDPNCFGGAPYQFCQEAIRQGFAHHGWRVDVRRLRRSRIIWNLGQVIRGRRHGGFQFSKAGRRAALSQIPAPWVGTEVISFHQHFPGPAEVIRAGGQVNYYVDSTYTQLFPSYGLDKSIDRETLREAIEYEREAFSLARRVIVNQSWALRSLLSDYGMDPSKCTVVLPAANYPVFPGYKPEVDNGRAGVDRPFVMGFIGKDWRRKGLVFLDQVARRLRAAGWKIRVRAIGFPAADAPPGAEVECLGFIDKRVQFAPFLHSCDVGCLFSSAEAAGTAVLEFMGVGIPVAGFTVNGLSDLLPYRGGFRFDGDTSPDEAAQAFDAYLKDESLQSNARAAARELAPELQWERCVREFAELWSTGAIKAPFRINAQVPAT